MMWLVVNCYFVNIFLMMQNAIFMNWNCLGCCLKNISLVIYPWCDSDSESFIIPCGAIEVKIIYLWLSITMYAITSRIKLYAFTILKEE